MAGYVLVLEPTKGGQRRLLQDSLSAQRFPGEFLVGLSDDTFGATWKYISNNIVSSLIAASAV